MDTLITGVVVIGQLLNIFIESVGPTPSGGYISNEEGTIPTVDPLPVAISIRAEVGSLMLEFVSESNVTYQLQSSTDFSSWVEEGEALVGSGESISIVLPAQGSLNFFRILAQ